MSIPRTFSAGFLHRGNTFLPFPPRFYDFPSPQRVETSSSEETEEISIDRKESKLHANFSYRSNSLSPRGNKNLILARLGLELFFLSPLQVPPENWNFLSSYRGGRYQFESSCLSCPTSAPPKFIIFSLNKERGEEKRKKKSFSILWAVNGIVREEKELFSY